ncbi:MAG: hypothetical protein JO072_13920 [Parafilimonas sp.]|nr:hypothetical protein [Parafilimonas sp.]
MVQTCSGFRMVKLILKFCKQKLNRKVLSEAALSPVKQLALIVFILETLKHNNAQFIIATHSPILMGIPGASLYEIREREMERVEYTDTEHYRITKRFFG